ESLPEIAPQILRCGAGHTRWRDDSLIGPWTRPGSATPRIVLSTMQTAAMPEFRAAMRQGSHLFLVADEVHRIGSLNHLQLLSLDTGPRLGLSATPRRAGDPAGTARILDYFQGIVPPPFRLADAISPGALTPYFYHVHTVMLTSAEQEEWDRLTKRIQRLAAQNASAKDPVSGADTQIERLLIERGRLLKQAADKAAAAASIVAANYHRGERWIVYCDDLVQLAVVQTALGAQGCESIAYHSAMTGDKEQTLRFFETNGG